jgi:hypothetical protein
LAAITNHHISGETQFETQASIDILGSILRASLSTLAQTTENRARYTVRRMRRSDILIRLTARKIEWMDGAFLLGAVILVLSALIGAWSLAPPKRSNCHPLAGLACHTADRPTPPTARS